MNEPLDPSHIMQTATAFWASKVLLTAVELDLFTTLGDSEQSAAQLGKALGLHPRGTFDFFDALVALKFLGRDGDGPEGQYRNTPQTAAFLNQNSPTYIGGLPQMLNSRLFGYWNHLGTALKTGQPQNEVKHGGKSIFEALYANEENAGRVSRCDDRIPGGELRAAGAEVRLREIQNPQRCRRRAGAAVQNRRITSSASVLHQL